MSAFKYYARTTTNISSIKDGGTQFNYKALTPFDRMKVLLEQAIYASYLTQTVGYSTTVRNMVQQIRMALVEEPSKIDTFTPVTDTLYEIGMKWAKRIVRPRAELRSENAPPDIRIQDMTNFQDLYQIFLQLPGKEYLNKEYTPTITEGFLTTWLAVCCLWYDVDKYQTGTANDAVLAIPCLQMVKSYSPYVNTEMSKNYDMVVAFTMKDMGVYTLNADHYYNDESVGYSCDLYEYLNRFDLSDYSVDDIIGLAASFALDHTAGRDRYVMTDSPGSFGFRVADVCFDLVTGSTHVTPPDAGSAESATDVLDFLHMLKMQIKHGRLQRVKDSVLFGELLRRIGGATDPDVINYFIKPVSLIAASEAYAFRHSEFASFMDDKFTPGMEADALEVPEDDTEEGEGTPDDPATDTPLESTSDDVLTDDTADEKPQIDPKMMLLELANPSESMADYIFRETVARRIEHILKNPPENAMPNDLLMLKRWRSRWLYLASVACLRDFLTRVAIRLS